MWGMSKNKKQNDGVRIFVGIYLFIKASSRVYVPYSVPILHYTTYKWKVVTHLLLSPPSVSLLHHGFPALVAAPPVMGASNVAAPPDHQ